MAQNEKTNWAIDAIFGFTTCKQKINLLPEIRINH